MFDFAAARLNMLESQLRPSAIFDERLLEAMATLPRELFLPKHLRGIAYVDEDIALGHGCFLMEPLVLARLIQLAEVEETDKVLDIGFGPGYSTAVLAKLGRNVIGLERDHALTAQAERHLRDLGIRNARFAEGPLEAGHVAGAPYDVILFGGAVEFVPQTIADQLAEGGRAVAVVRAPGRVGQIEVMTRVAGTMRRHATHDAATLPLPGFARPPAFVF